MSMEDPAGTRRSRGVPAATTVSRAQRRAISGVCGLKRTASHAYCRTTSIRPAWAAACAPANSWGRRSSSSTARTLKREMVSTAPTTSPAMLRRTQSSSAYGCVAPRAISRPSTSSAPAVPSARRAAMWGRAHALSSAAECSAAWRTNGSSREFRNASWNRLRSQRSSVARSGPGKPK